jgi:hypothetical protein
MEGKGELVRGKQVGGVSANANTYENEWQNFDPTGVRPFVPDDIAELTDGKRLCHRARSRERIWQVIEPVGNRCILHDVALV